MRTGGIPLNRTLVLLLALALVPIALAPADAIVEPAAACPTPTLPTATAADAFDSRGVFSYQALVNGRAFGGAGLDVASLQGPTMVCREPVDPNAIQQCLATGTSIAPPIRTEMVQLGLHGTSDAALPTTIRESPTRASTGLVGPVGIPLACDLRTGTVRFAGNVDSFFDVFFEIELPGVGWAPSAQNVHVTDRICGLPAGPEHITPCQPAEPYQHVGGPMATLQAVTGGIYSNSACHLPFFVPTPPPTGCGGAGPRNADSSTPSFFDVFFGDVSGRTVTSVTTQSTSAPAGVSVTVTPWSDADGNGVWRAKVLVAPAPTILPPCGSGTIPIEIVPLALTSAGPESTKIHADVCQAP